MKNKTIAAASALAIGGLLTINSALFVFADGMTTTSTTTNLQKRTAVTGKMMTMKDGFGDKRDNMIFRGEKGVNALSTQLKDYVTDGTITQATLDKIVAYENEQLAARKAEAEKLQGMTKEEIRAYFEATKAAKPEKVNIFTALVDKGILTQAQADTITAKMQAKREAARTEQVTTALNTLVTNKTITQEQATKIFDYMKKQHDAREAEMAKIKAMTETEREAYFKANPPTRTSFLSELVTQGVLTQAQADAAAKALHGNGRGNGMHMKNAPVKGLNPSFNG